MEKLIEIVSYNPEWPTLFEAEAKRIQEILGDNCIEIHHIGSTSVKGLAAKPVIDMMPVVQDLKKIDKFIKNLEQLGYKAKGEYGIPFRRYFQKGILNRTHNVHIFEKDNPEIERHLKFRNWMRDHPIDCQIYTQLKLDLATQYPNDMMQYSLGKKGYIDDIDRKTGSDDLRIVHALTDAEWNAARRFRQKYFFDNVPIADPYTWTFDHQDHVHFILYKGVDVIGYAHIQLWPEARTALRIIVIDENQRNNGFGSIFLGLIEKWLKDRHIKTLHIESSPKAYPFYCKHNYVHLPFNDPDHHEHSAEDIAIGKVF